MSVSTSAATGDAPRRRPKNRKDQIIDAARELIGELGYRNVSMAQIADRVGITAGALYRHFSNKAVLLAAAIDQSLDEVSAATNEHGVSVEDTCKVACERVVSQRDLGALLWRESRYLDRSALTSLRGRLHDMNRSYRALIRAERPALSDIHGERLAWGVQSILASPSFHATKVAHTEFVALLSTACRALCAVELSPQRPPEPGRFQRLEPVSKRERMLAHAVVLFERNGFDDTGLNDIGAAAGVTGPNLYSYFENKADIFETALGRGVSALWLLLHAVLRDNDNPADALGDLVRGYTQLALERIILASTLLTEQGNMDANRRARQREYVSEWVALLRTARPALDETSARVLVHTALAVIHNMAHIGREQDDPGFAEDVALMANAVLFSL